jgi:hypothetical protein
MISVTVITIGNFGNDQALFVTLSDIQRNKERGKQLSDNRYHRYRTLPSGGIVTSRYCLLSMRGGIPSILSKRLFGV